MLTGDIDTPAEARAVAREWLMAHGMDGFAAEAAVFAARVRRAHWGGSTVGFVPATHPDASPVVVIHIGLDPITR